MEHYITEIRIEKLRHLENVTINLKKERKTHLIITGKNGSGKTSLLNAISSYLALLIYNGPLALNTGILPKEIKLSLSYDWDLNNKFKDGNFIIASFSADRKTKVKIPDGVENIKLQKSYKIKDDPSDIFVKYMVHLKTQQSYARNENDLSSVDRIQKWFERFEKGLRELFEDESLELIYEYKEYNFKIKQKGKEAFGLNQMSDGYSAVINILSSLILRMDKNWILNNELSDYDIEGIVLIDEIETHLHLELQKKILPFLINFFSGIQFIVSTHSPYILNSIENAKAYDLENNLELENLISYSAEELSEAYFEADDYSHVIKDKIRRYKELRNCTNLSAKERGERAELKIELEEIASIASKEIKNVLHNLKLED